MQQKGSKASIFFLVLILLLLIFALKVKYLIYQGNPWTLDFWKKEFRQQPYFNLFTGPRAKYAQLFSLDRKLFLAKFLDFYNILNRPTLYLTNGWKPLTQAVHLLDPRDPESIYADAFQYTSKNENLLWLHKFIQKYNYLPLMKPYWKFLMVMAYLMQFQAHNLKGAVYYAKGIIESPQAPLAAKELAPVLLFKLGKKEAALAMYQLLYKEAKNENERKMIEKKIKEILSGGKL